MAKKNMLFRTRKIRLIGLAVLMGLAMLASPVLADGEALPEDVSEPAEMPQSVLSSEVPKLDPVPVLNIEDAVPAEEPLFCGADLCGEEEVDQAELVNSAAEAGVALSDADGAPLEFASQDSAQALLGADPYFFNGGIKYQFLPDGMTCPTGTEGITCWVSVPGDNPIQDAIEYINANGKVPTDRKIYVESGEYTGDVHIDTSTEIFSSLLNGLIGVYDSATETRPIINGNVFINQNISGFTLSGFTINGSLTVTDSIGTLILDDLDVTSPNGDGINIHNQDGNIEIKNTRSSGNYGSGAILEYETTAGNVTVRNSAFDDNGTSLNLDYEVGILISTSKAIILEGVSASRNQGSGMELVDFSALTIKNAVANYNEELYNENQVSEGIYAVTDLAAVVTLENIQANYNASDGIYIGTSGDVYATNIEAQYNTMRTGTIENLQKFGEFLSDDVEYDEWRFYGIENQDVVITLESTGSRHTFDPLLRLYDSTFTLLAEDDNSLGGEDAQITYTLSGAGTYYIRVYRADSGTHGSYDLGLNHNDNVTHVVNRDPSGFSFSTWDGTGQFKLTNGYFNQNAGEGLYIYNRNSVTLSSITSSNNGGDGIYINKSGSDWDCPPGGGACTLLGYSGVGTVTITSPKSSGWITANSTTGNDGAGLYVFSTGNILISNIDAVENAIGGLTLNNCLVNYTTGVCQGYGNVLVNVTIPNWSNYFGENSGNGINVSSTGAVTIENVGTKYNGNKGIGVSTSDTITLKNVNVFHNYDTGAYLTNLSATKPRTVTIIDSTFNENEGTGLVIDASGSIILRGVSADDNFSPVSGTLDSVPASVYDRILPGDVSEIYYFYGRGGQWLDIILDSTAFDTYLELNDNIGDPISSDDNSGEGTNARIIYSLPYTGWFQIKVGYIGTEEFGDYILSVNDFYNENPVYPGSGVEMDNSTGVGDIIITTTKITPASSFSNNQNYGLHIKTNGSATITGASGNSNYRSGIQVDALKMVTVQDQSKVPAATFNNNGNYGVFVKTLGAIKLYGISASENILNGADLENCFYSGALFACTGSGTVTVSTKTNYLADFSSNGGHGVRVDANSSIYLTNANAEDNGLSGISLKNDYTSGVAYVRNFSKTVSSAFDNNGSYGIYILSLRNIMLENLSADGNGLSGAFLDNCREDAGLCLGFGPTTISAPKNMTASFSGNGDHGILAYSYSTIKLINVQANDNGLSGAYLDNNYEGSTGSVFLQRSGTVTNQFNDNGSAGLYGGSAPSYRVGLFVDSRGTINLKNLEASNTEDGGVASTWYGTPFAGSGLLAANNYGDRANKLQLSDGYFYGNADHGMRLFSYGAISLQNITASGNGDIGALVKNDYPDLKGGVSLLTGGGGWNTFSGNNGAGLQVETNGAVTLKDISAAGNRMLTNTLASGGIGTASVQEFFNAALGADVWEFYATAGVPLTIQLDKVWSPTGEVFDPFLSLYDAGQVQLASDDNSGGGLNAEISYTPSVDGWYYLHVTGRFDVDGGYVLGINDPVFSDLTVLQAHGVSISAGMNISLKGSATNSFKENSQAGLFVKTGGSIYVQRVSATGNGTFGAVLDNSSGLGYVTVVGANASNYSYFSDNSQDGLVISTPGNVTLNHLWAEANGLRGISAGSALNPAVGNLTINNVLALENSGSGMEAYSTGLINALKLQALDNGEDGAYLNNTSGLNKVTISGESFFNGNGDDGLEVLTQNHLAISKVTAENNGGDGIAADSVSGNLTLSQINVKYSGTNGLLLSGNSNITLSNLTSLGNGSGTDGDGIQISASATTVISINNASFMANEGNGIEISSGQIIPTLLNTFYFGNDVDNDGDLNYYWH